MWFKCSKTRACKAFTCTTAIKFYSILISCSFYFICIFTAMEGWGPWSSWSVCDADAMQTRRRKCLTEPAPGLCQGRSQEERVCTNNLEGIKWEFILFIFFLETKQKQRPSSSGNFLFKCEWLSIVITKSLNVFFY